MSRRILTIIGVGLILIFIAWIFVIIGFFSMKPKEYQPYTHQPKRLLHRTTNNTANQPKYSDTNHKYKGDRSMTEPIEVQTRFRLADAS